MNTLTKPEPRTPNYATGMTLIELILVVVIFGVIGAIFSQFLAQAYRASASSQDLTTVDWQARVTMERMKRDLREARSATAADLSWYTSADITFTNTGGQSLTYYILAPNQLKRLVNTGCLGCTGMTLAENVTAITFSYRDVNSAVTAAVGNVRLITVDMTMTLNDVTRTYRFTVYPRNFPR